MTVIKDQKIKLHWNNNNKHHFIKLRYPELKIGEVFYISPQDLMDNNNKEVECVCDMCDKNFYLKHLYARKNESHFCSDECRSRHNKHNKDFLINEFYRFFKENSKYPHQNEMLVREGYPSHYYYTKLFGSWDTFIKEINIYSEYGNWLKQDIETLRRMYESESKDNILNSLINDYGWDHVRWMANHLDLYRIGKVRVPSSVALKRNFLISEYWRYVDKYDKIPLLKEFKANSNFPSETGYRRIWGTWYNFLKDIDVMRGDCEDGWYIHDENILKEYYPDKYINTDFIIQQLMVKRQWSQIKKKSSKLGLTRGKGNQKQFTHDALIEEIMRYHKEYNCVPTYEEFAQNKDFPSAKVVKSYFGSWNNAIVKAGFNENLIRYHTKQDVVDELNEFYKKYNRAPYSQEFKYSTTVVYGYWKSWYDMLIDCKIPLNKSFFGIYTKDQNGVIHRSKSEAIITNILINNAITYELEEKYSKYINNFSNGYLFDWTIKQDGELFFIEFFGMASNSNIKEVIDYKSKMSKKIKLCNKNNLTLIPLFMSDLNNNCKGIVKKLSEEGIDLKIENILYKEVSFS